MTSQAPETWTLRKALAWMSADFRQRGIESARLDAELLAAHALGCERIGLYMDLDRPLNEGEREGMRSLVQRRRRFEPVAYILGRREFYGRSFQVSSAVLVPRPDTETLVEKALEWIDAHACRRVLDLCTGSGAIALSLAAERPELQVDASDLSAAALAVARANRDALGLSERVRLYEGDLCAALPEGARYDLITCNPPYISDAEWPTLPPDVAEHEPALALRGGAEGLDFYRRLAQELPAFMEAGAGVLLEIGWKQAQAVRALFEANAAFEALHCFADLGGNDRVIRANRRAG